MVQDRMENTAARGLLAGRRGGGSGACVLSAPRATSTPIGLSKSNRSANKPPVSPMPTVRWPIHYPLGVRNCHWSNDVKCSRRWALKDQRTQRVTISSQVLRLVKRGVDPNRSNGDWIQAAA
jgi:hypothetical protein